MKGGKRGGKSDRNRHLLSTFTSSLALSLPASLPPSSPPCPSGHGREKIATAVHGVHWKKQSLDVRHGTLGLVSGRPA